MCGRFAWVKVALWGWLATACVANAEAAVYKVGSGSGCTHSTIQAAVDAAAANPGFDYIRITRSKTYTTQAVRVPNGFVQFEGGWQSCASATADYVKTTVSGAGGSASPVFYIDGSSPRVLFADLAIVSGDASGSGGGVMFAGVYGGELTLRNVHLSQNAARWTGGGLYVWGTPEHPVEVWIDGGTLIEGNRSDYVGGGVYCENAHVRVQYFGTRISLNDALHGGGIYAQHCHLDIASTGRFPTFGAISVNRARGDGGGIYLSGHSYLYLRNMDSTAPTMINWNSAEGVGGGLYVTGGSLAYALSSIIDGNVAGSGGAGVALIDRGEGAVLVMYRTPGDCAANLECNRISNNTARSAAGLNQHGAAILQSVQDVHNIGDSLVQLDAVAVTGNTGETAIRSQSLRGTAAPMYIAGSVLAFNKVSGDLIQHVKVDPATTAISFWIDGITIAQNEVGSGVVVRSYHDLVANGSIVWQPGARPFELIGPPFQWSTMENMLVNELGSIPASPKVIVADPDFVNRAGGDFRLNQFSPAVDFTSGAIFSVTRDGRDRSVDLPSVPNRFGPIDLGAYERQAETDGFLDQ